MVSYAATSAWSATPRAWAGAQLPHLPTLLIEQAHLEKKAAAAAMQFLFRVPIDHASLRGLSALAREELVHFERTVKLVASRGITLGALEPAAYAGRLKAGMGSTMPERLVDELLVSAVIEARSHERMGLLAAELADRDAEVADFYSDLCTAEERHAELYLEIAAKLLPAEVVAQRHAALLQREGALLRELPWVPRLHGGLAGMELG